MTRPVTARGDRVLGRGLLALANVITMAAPVAADWNDSHIFNSRWPGHARFHGVTALTMATTLSALNVWSVCSGGHDRDTVRFFAAAVPVAYWAPFFVAPLHAKYVCPIFAFSSAIFAFAASSLRMPTHS